jgi:hypothetical protein
MKNSTLLSTSVELMILIIALAYAITAQGATSGQNGNLAENVETTIDDYTNCSHINPLHENERYIGHDCSVKSCIHGFRYGDPDKGEIPAQCYKLEREDEQINIIDLFTGYDCGSVDYSNLKEKKDDNAAHYPVFYVDKDSNKQGRYRSYYDTGRTKLEAIGCYLNDKKTGTWTLWYESGKKYSSGDYKDDKMTGTWTMWHENGNKYSSGNFTDDNITGTWTMWHENGNKKEEGSYKGGFRLTKGRWSP